VSPSGAEIALNGEVVSRNGSYSAEVIPGTFRVDITSTSGDYLPVHQTVTVGEDQEVERDYKLSETAEAQYRSKESAATVFFVLGGVAIVGGTIEAIVGAASTCPYDGISTSTLTSAQQQKQKDCDNTRTNTAIQGLEVLVGGAVLLGIGAGISPAGPEPAAGRKAQVDPPTEYFSLAPCAECSGVPAAMAYTRRF
ncbi:MAG TPA: hypothetical protein VL359_14250, partial [bacterium]|nr:hypothetical protein [bacterium]